MLLYAHDMILYTENLKESTQKLLQKISEFRKLAGYKINIQKLVEFLYTKNAILEKEHQASHPSSQGEPHSCGTAAQDCQLSAGVSAAQKSYNKPGRALKRSA